VVAWSHRPGPFPTEPRHGLPWRGFSFLSLPDNGRPVAVLLYLPVGVLLPTRAGQ